MFTSATNGVVLNFAGSPAKPIWNGSIGVSRFSTPGTYTLEMMGQADRYTYYRGSITLTILPIATMTVSVQQVGYLAEEDVMLFVVDATRHLGYSKPIERLFGYTDGLVLECAFEPVDFDTYAMACAHASGTRPTTGMVKVNVFMFDEVFSGSTTFNLPPR
jgi:hypothetical protein